MDGHSDSTDSYIPQAGDVVEFEYSYDGIKIATGLVYTYMSGKFAVWHNGENRLVTGDLFSDQKKRHRKIGQSSITSGASRGEAERIAKAYFAKEPEYKMGDLVEAIDGGGDYDEEFDVGSIVLVRDPKDSCGHVWCEDNEGQTSYADSFNLRPLSGTYAERQAKFIKFHGLKAGDKVKVVRKVEKDGCGWNRQGKMDTTIGTIGEILITCNTCVTLEMPADNWSYHYECLEPSK